MVRKIRVYKPLTGDPPFYDFIKGLDPRLAKKLLWQVYCIASGTERCMSEPHVKHFTLERYKELYELRERGSVLARIIFTMWDGEIILLSAFIKKQARDT